MPDSIYLNDFPHFFSAFYFFSALRDAFHFFSVGAGASPYNMGPASQGTPTPMMSPAPPGGQQDSMGYNMNMNGGDYSSSMSGSQVSLQCLWPLNFLNWPAQTAFCTTWGLRFPYSLLGYDTIYEDCPEISVHLEYLENRSRGLDVTLQPVRGDLSLQPWTVTDPWG